jgi:uncharacterized protein
VDSDQSASAVQSAITRREPAVAGWFTIDDATPALLGRRCNLCGTYVFPPKTLGCPNPECESESFETVELSRHGRIWSYTDARYQPPAPYVAADPFEPFCIAAVELDKEKIVVLGQVVDGYSVGDLHVGMEVELVLGTLNPEPAVEAGAVIWKWRPVNESA